MPLNFIIKILRASAKFHRSLKEHYKNWRPRQVKNVFKSWICFAILGNFFRILPLTSSSSTADTTAVNFKSQSLEVHCLAWDLEPNLWPVTSSTTSPTTEPSPHHQKYEHVTLKPKQWKWKLKWTLNLKSESAQKTKKWKNHHHSTENTTDRKSPKFFSKLTPTVFFKTFPSVFFKTNTCLFQDSFQLF